MTCSVSGGTYKDHQVAPAVADGSFVGALVGADSAVRVSAARVSATRGSLLAGVTTTVCGTTTVCTIGDWDGVGDVHAASKPSAITARVNRNIVFTETPNLRGGYTADYRNKKCHT
jgi:hypothetical protein